MRQGEGRARNEAEQTERQGPGIVKRGLCRLWKGRVRFFLETLRGLLKHFEWKNNSMKFAC